MLSRAVPATAFRHWLATVNISLAVYLAGGLAAPVSAAVGLSAIASALYAVYHLTCHQWAFRSFFLFAPTSPTAPGDHLGGLAIYTEQQLSALGVDPFSFAGSATLGVKMAFCERDLAIYVGLLAVGLVYARTRQVAPLSFGVYGMLILPMAVDGFTQLFGWRESTWQLRVGTGLLFGVASGWLVLPRLDATFGLAPAARQYSPEAICAPAPVVPALATVESRPMPTTLQHPAQTSWPQRIDTVEAVQPQKPATGKLSPGG